MCCLLLLALVNDNVEFVVVKTGSLGDVVVSWQVGQITPEEGVADGSLLPSSGSIRMAYNQTRADFKLTVSQIGTSFTVLTCYLIWH